MGPPWIEYDTMWARYNVMVMDVSHSDIFVKAWRLKQCDVDVKGEGEGDDAAGANPNAKAKAKAKAKGKAKAAGQKRGAGGEVAGGGQDPKRIGTPLSFANKTKVNYKTALTAAWTLQSVIRSGAAARS
eukprot:8255038-Heterocapsa_arctica.AAC.1